MKGFMSKALAATLGAVLVLSAALAKPEESQALASHKLLIGATLVKEDISYWENKLDENSIMRVFPNSNGLIPAASDDRFDYAERVGMRQIFVSTKIHSKYVGNGHGTWAAGMTDTKNKIKALIDTGNFDVVWYTEHHEPEQGSDALTPYWYKTRYTQSGGVFDTIDGIGSSYRPKVKVGHVLTRQWTENTPGRTYQTYDTGLGDFFGVDMYANTFTGGNVATSYPDAEDFTTMFKNYKFNSSDERPRFWPELGAVGLPFDTDGLQRDLWLQAVHAQAKTWDPASTGWNMVGWIWWNAEGKSGDTLPGSPGIGTKRWFQLDRRHDGTDLVPGGSNDKNGYETLNPPKPLDRWNQLSAWNNPSGL